MVAFKHVSELTVALVVGGGYLIVRGYLQFRRKRVVEDTPTSRVATAALGLVEFQGHAWSLAADHERSIFGEPVAYKQITIQKYVKRGKNSSWETVYTDSTYNPFLLCDQTGYALVVPTRVTLDAKPRVKSWNELQPEIRNYYATAAGVESGAFGGGIFAPKLRIVESCLLLGSPMYARGHWEGPHADSPKGIDPKPGLRAFEQYKKSNSVRRLDRNRNGRISESEAREGYYGIAVATSLKPAAEEQIAISGVLTANGVHELFIADCHQEHLLARLGKFQLLMIVAGVVMLAAGINIIWR